MTDEPRVSREVRGHGCDGQGLVVTPEELGLED